MKKMILLMVLLMTAMIFAQEAQSVSSVLAGNAPQAPAAVLEESTSITISQIMTRGGWLMYVIAGLSFVAIALAIFYALTMRATILFPKKFTQQAQELADANDIDGLRAICQEDQCSAAHIVNASLEQIIPGHPLNYDRLHAAMEDEGNRQAGILWQRLQYLMDIAVISPMVGLLGTVWGMMLSFGGIENGADFAKKAETMANGISQAMYTTFGGLIVGIFAMALYDIARGHLNKLIGQMESACSSILRKLVK